MKLLKDKKIFKYLAVGFTAFFVDYFLFLLLNQATTMPVFSSNAAALITGFLVSFFGNRLLVFGADKASAMRHTLHKQLLLYVALLIVNTGLSYLVISGLENIGVSVVVGKAISMVFIVGWNYVLYKKVIFRQA